MKKPIYSLEVEAKGTPLSSGSKTVRWINKMKRSLLLVCFLSVSFFPASSPLARASDAETRFPRLSLKLTGGLGFLTGGGGDLETLRTDTQAIFRSLTRITGFESSFDWKSLPASPEMGAELILSLGPHLGLGLGSGYIFGSRSRGAFSYSYSIAQFLQGSGYSEDDQAIYSQDFKFRAVPVRANIYVSNEFGGFTVYGFGGPELYFASIDHVYSLTAALQDKGLSSYAPHTEHDVDSTFTARETVTSRALGFRAGLGFEVRVAGPLSIGMEVFGRILRLSNWNGDGTIDSQTRVRDWMDGFGWYNDTTTTDSLSPSGQWLYTFDFDPSLRYLFTLENLLLENQKTQYSTYFKSRDAVIDLGGVGVLLSVRYRL